MLPECFGLSSKPEQKSDSYKRRFTIFLEYNISIWFAIKSNVKYTSPNAMSSLTHISSIVLIQQTHLAWILSLVDHLCKNKFHILDKSRLWKSVEIYCVKPNFRRRTTKQSKRRSYAYTYTGYKTENALNPPAPPNEQDVSKRTQF